MTGFFILQTLFLVFAASAFSQMPISTEAYQLQQLVEVSKQQLKSAKEMLEYGKQDADALERSTRALQKLSAGIDESIEKYQGTAAYEQALLALQAEDAAKKDFNPGALDSKKSDARFNTFQSQTVKASQADLIEQQKLSEALRTAEQGFVTKLHAQSQIGNWQTNTRVSSQLTELISAIHGLRQDLAEKNQGRTILEEILMGAEIQNKKQREVLGHGSD